MSSKKKTPTLAANLEEEGIRGKFYLNRTIITQSRPFNPIILDKSFQELGKL